MEGTLQHCGMRPRALATMRGDSLAPTPIDKALDSVLDVNSEMRRHSIRVVIESVDEGIDDRLLTLLTEHSAVPQVVSTICRILAERQPDRDPQFAFESLLGSRYRQAGPVSSFLYRQAYRNPMGLAYGICRLRRAEPVDHYSRNMKSWRAMARFAAVMALGDTADIRAVPFLVNALRDRNWRVRHEAAVSIRRLARDVGLIVRDHQGLKAGLIKGLLDRHREVVEEVACALSDLELRSELEREFNSSSLGLAARRIIETVLNGTITIIHPTWVGEPLPNGV